MMKNGMSTRTDNEWPTCIAWFFCLCELNKYAPRTNRFFLIQQWRPRLWQQETKTNLTSCQLASATGVCVLSIIWSRICCPIRGRHTHSAHTHSIHRKPSRTKWMKNIRLAEWIGNRATGENRSFTDWRARAYVPAAEPSDSNETTESNCILFSAILYLIKIEYLVLASECRYRV